MRTITILGVNAVAIAVASLGVELWIQNVHSPDEGAPIGAGLAHIVLLMLISALTTYWLTVPLESALRHQLMLTVANLVLASAVLYVFFTWKDSLAEAAEFTVTSVFFLAVGAGIGLMARSLNRP